jgi:hypothetical protein
MLMKTMLSIPRTISSTLKVSNAIQPSGWLTHEKSNIDAAASSVIRGERSREPVTRKWRMTKTE